MKTKIIILVLFLVLILICVTTTIKLNTLPKELTDFKENIIKENFLIKETTNDYNDSLVIESYIFYNNDYQIEFITFDNEDSCNIAFNTNIKSLEQENIKENLDIHKNYSIYTYINNNNYVYLRKEKNTLIYINTDIKYKESILKLLKKLI